jgi:hypothetical protein
MGFSGYTQKYRWRAEKRVGSVGSRVQYRMKDKKEAVTVERLSF